MPTKKGGKKGGLGKGKKKEKSQETPNLAKKSAVLQEVPEIAVNQVLPALWKGLSNIRFRRGTDFALACLQGLNL